MFRILQLIKILNGIHFSFTLPTAMLCGLILYLLCAVLFFRRYGIWKNLGLMALFVYAAAVLQLTQTFAPPQMWQLSSASAQRAVASIEWIPFRSSVALYRNGLTTGNFDAFIRGVGGNFIMLMPLGILLPLLSPNFGLGGTALTAVLVSVWIEGFQFLSNLLSGAAIRHVQTEDVLLNTVGCLIAYLLLSAVRSLIGPKYPARHLGKRKHLRGKASA